MNASLLDETDGIIYAPRFHHINILDTWSLDRTWSVPHLIWPTVLFILCMGLQEYVREPLGMTNGRIGYVYLVDENMKIRWAACADAKKEEEEALIRCAGVLLNRHKRPSSTPGTPTSSPPKRRRTNEEE
jgi:hypothetical protein